MLSYAQTDPRWSNRLLGTSSVTIGNYGCAITALGNMANKTPLEVNEILKRGGGFLQGSLVIWGTACNLLGLKWSGTTTTQPKLPCIAQVRGSGFPMHFVIILGGGQIIDSYDGRTKKNPYLIVSYRAVSAPNQPAPTPPPASSFNVRVDKAVASVRTAPRVSAPLGGSQYLYKGNVFTSTGTVQGDSVSGNATWYRSTKGNYVWSGGLTKI